jgi:hypothetical protein
MAQSQSRQGIPTYLTLEQFKEFVLPHLHIGSRGPQPKLSLHATIQLHSKAPVPRLSVERTAH